MREEYDFKRGQRGKFYHQGATLQLLVYLDEEVQSYLSEKADKKGVPLDDLVNDLLKKEIAIIEAMK